MHLLNQGAHAHPHGRPAVRLPVLRLPVALVGRPGSPQEEEPPPAVAEGGEGEADEESAGLNPSTSSASAGSNAIAAAATAGCVTDRANSASGAGDPVWRRQAHHRPRGRQSHHGPRRPGCTGRLFTFEVTRYWVFPKLLNLGNPRNP